MNFPVIMGDANTVRSTKVKPATARPMRADY